MLFYWMLLPLVSRVNAAGVEVERQNDLSGNPDKPGTNQHCPKA